ncbi:MAG: HlyD family type I secretion periplasmic adaptor subunit [Sulfurovum sp.]|nr:HlyD family type I secretion periplasmic adaptor subunit [Sulfurovaceae bacterium]
MSKLTPKDYEFMNSLSAAMVEESPKKIKGVLYFWVITISIFFIWANYTEIDEITRGTGEVVPSGKNQIIQNLEGGIVEKVFVRIGQEVVKGQKLLKIDNRKSLSQLGSMNIKALELRAKLVRLSAEAYNIPFEKDISSDEILPELLENEESLYDSQQAQFKAKIAVILDQKLQKSTEYEEIEQKIIYLTKSKDLINKEVKMMRPMVIQGVKSKVAFMKLQREQNSIQEELHSAEFTLPKIKAGISELNNKISEVEGEFRNQAKKEFNEAVAELMRIDEDYDALDDQISRTLVRSPTNGIIEEVNINTVGGVIKPGDKLIEIVPTDGSLWMEVKIKPSDIAFIYPGEKAIVKITAYDYALYGSLDGEVVHMGADTTKDSKENSFYLIHIKTDKNFLGSVNKPLKIIPGMMVNVDIMTGKKSVMDYILKPILKAKQYTFTER